MKKLIALLIGIVAMASCARVSGTYVNVDKGLYEKIEFVGSSSCIITALGFDIPASYRIDNGHVIISAEDGKELMFQIQDSQTLVGRGFFNESTYKKVTATTQAPAPESK